VTDINYLAARAYRKGIPPVDWAETLTESAIETHLMITRAREDNPAAYPCYPIGDDLASLARHILGELLDAGWTMPEAGDTP